MGDERPTRQGRTGHAGDPNAQKRSLRRGPKADAAAGIPLAALPDHVSKKLVTHWVEATHGFEAQSSDPSSPPWRNLHAIRDWSDHNSMNPGEAACANSPPDWANDASCSS